MCGGLQVKDSGHKLERAREGLLTKERECRRLETEAKVGHTVSLFFEGEVEKFIYKGV